MNDADQPAQPLRFSNESKLLKQMRKRLITEVMIREAMTYEGEPWHGKLGPALRYKSRTTGIVVVDVTTDEIFHVGTARFRYDDA